MGLFSGGGVLGDVGGFLGINSDKQERSIRDATAAQNRKAEEGIGDIFGQLDLSLQNLQPFSDAGMPALAGLEQGSTLGGFSRNLSDIFNSPSFDPIVAERMRAANSALGSAGLTRSGGAIQAAADIPLDVALGLEQLLSGRRSELAGLGFDSSAQQSLLRSAAGSGAANIRIGQGANSANSILAQQQAKTQRNENIGGFLGGSNIAGGGGGGGGGLDLGGIISIGSKIAGLFSDPRLKTNIKPVGDFHGMNVYEWDWIDGVPELLGEDLMNTGFLADEVAEKYPEYSGESHGFLTIDYKGLVNHLEESCLH
jgi:hypothetical protein